MADVTVVTRLLLLGASSLVFAAAQLQLAASNYIEPTHPYCMNASNDVNDADRPRSWRPPRRVQRSASPGSAACAPARTTRTRGRWRSRRPCTAPPSRQPQPKRLPQRQPSCQPQRRVSSMQRQWRRRQSWHGSRGSNSRLQQGRQPRWRKARDWIPARRRPATRRSLCRRHRWACRRCQLGSLPAPSQSRC